VEYSELAAGLSHQGRDQVHSPSTPLHCQQPPTTPRWAVPLPTDPLLVAMAGEQAQLAVRAEGVGVLECSEAVAVVSEDVAAAPPRQATWQHLVQQLVQPQVRLQV